MFSAGIQEPMDLKEPSSPAGRKADLYIATSIFRMFATGIGCRIVNCGPEMDCLVKIPCSWLSPNWLVGSISLNFSHLPEDQRLEKIKNILVQFCLTKT